MRSFESLRIQLHPQPVAVDVMMMMMMMTMLMLMMEVIMMMMMMTRDAVGADLYFKEFFDVNGGERGERGLHQHHSNHGKGRHGDGAFERRDAGGEGELKRWRRG
jgi:hypothetical protein